MVNKKLLQMLMGKSKDLGLDAKAIEEIAGIASNGLGDNPTDEAVTNAANLYFPVLQTMQKEATRWAQKRNPNVTDPPTPPKPNEAGEELKAVVAELLAPLKTTIEQQNATITQLQTKLTGNEREATIKAEMAKLGLTDADMEFVTVPSDANIGEYLGKFKQSLVNRGLKPVDTQVSRETKDKANADLVAEMLKSFTVGASE